MIDQDGDRAAELAATLSRDTTVDSATARLADEFDRCIYVYKTETEVRECLVFKYGWTPPDAERRLALHRAALQRAIDSIEAEVARVTDSIDRERAKERAIAAAAAAKRRAQQEAVAKAADERRRAEHAKRSAEFAAKYPWIGNLRGREYFKGSLDCSWAYHPAMKPGTENWPVFSNANSAERAGLKRSTLEGC